MKASTKEGLELYRDHGIHPGDFLIAVLENKLIEAFALADDANAATMAEIVLWVYNDLPRGAWGDPDRVKYWMAKHGLEAYEHVS